MNKLICIISSLLLISCSNLVNIEELVGHKITTLDKHNNILDSCRINVLRYPATKIEYEIHEKVSGGKYILQSFPKQIVYQSNLSDSSAFSFLDFVNDFNNSDKQVLRFLEFSNNQKSVEVITDENQIIYISNYDSGNRTKVKINSEVNETWYYSIVEVDN